jgi:hypothetical protein
MVRVADAITGYGGSPSPDELATAIDDAPEPAHPDGLSDTARAMLPTLRGEAQDLVEAFFLDVIGRKRRKRKNTENPENAENSRNPENSRNAENSGNSGNAENSENSVFPPRTPFSENCSQSDKQRASADAPARTTDDAQGLEDYEAAARLAGIQGDELRRFLEYNARKGGSVAPSEAVRRWTARRTATEAAGGPGAVTLARASARARDTRAAAALAERRAEAAKESNVQKILRLAEERHAATPAEVEAIAALPEVDAFYGETIEAVRRWKEAHP